MGLAGPFAGHCTRFELLLWNWEAYVFSKHWKTRQKIDKRNEFVLAIWDRKQQFDDYNTSYGLRCTNTVIFEWKMETCQLVHFKPTPPPNLPHYITLSLSHSLLLSFIADIKKYAFSSFFFVLVAVCFVQAAWRNFAISTNAQTCVSF